MDKIFDTLLTWQFLLFCLGIAAITSFVRNFIDYNLNKYKFAKYKKLFYDVILPSFPIGAGTLIAYLATKYPYPPEVTGASGRIFFGMVAGLFSGFVYRLFKSLLLSNIKGTEDPKDNLINSVKSKFLNNNNQ